MDPVGIQSGRGWAPILHVWGPVGIQSGSRRAPMSGGIFLQGFGTFLGDFSCFPTGPNVGPKIRKLVPDWIPTGQKWRAKKCNIGARLRPGYFFKKILPALLFSKFEHLFLKFEHLAVHHPAPCSRPPPCLKPNTGNSMNKNENAQPRQDFEFQLWGT